MAAYCFVMNKILKIMSLINSKIKDMPEVSILMIFRHNQGRFRPNFGRMAARPKLNLCSSSTPTAAAATAERMNIIVVMGSIKYLINTIW